MNVAEKIRLESKHNERISVLDREQARIERQISDLERKKQGIVMRINAEIRSLQLLKRIVVK